MTVDSDRQKRDTVRKERAGIPLANHKIRDGDRDYLKKDIAKVLSSESAERCD